MLPIKIFFYTEGPCGPYTLSDDLATRQIELDQMTHTQPHWILVDVVTELARRHAEKRVLRLTQKMSRS